MDASGYVTLTRQSGLLAEMRVVANNIANANTTGFRREGVIFAEAVQVLPAEGGSVAMTAARAKLQTQLELERDANVRQDLQILLTSIDQSIEGSTLGERYLLPWTDAPQLIFGGINGLLSTQTPPERRVHALARLQRYAGLAEGSTPITTLARQRYEERLSNPDLLPPTRREVQRALDSADTYIAGIRKLFEAYGIDGAEPALEAIAKEITAYADWTRSTVLPNAREDTRLPPELYAFGLKQYGTDVDPQLLMQRAQLAFMEIRAQMQQLAPLVAKEKGIAATDYREVIAALKRETIPNDRLEASYREVIDAIDPIIEREHIVDVPQRQMQMRLGSEAESAASPAPHFRPAPLVGNTGQQGTFVLPLGNPGGDGEGDAYDDFNFDAVRWTLSAHEGRPGHELQFTAMVERGVSLARSMFAFNSVDVEGWDGESKDDSGATFTFTPRPKPLPDDIDEPSLADASVRDNDPSDGSDSDSDGDNGDGNGNGGPEGDDPKDGGPKDGGSGSDNDGIDTNGEPDVISPDVPSETPGPGNSDDDGKNPPPAGADQPM